MKSLLKLGYWLAQLTWGALMTIPGILVGLFACIFMGGKIYKNGFSYIITVGDNWGGVNLGAISLCGNYYGGSYWEEIRRHEAGHSIQNIIFGPLQLILVAIPSAFRYWYQIIREKKGKVFPSDWYYKAWFEHDANVRGDKYINFSEK